MKQVVVSALALLAFASSVFAQVTLEVTADQSEFIPGESIPIKVRIVNNSGQTIRFGKEDWLNYIIEARDGYIVMKTGDVPQPHDFDVKAAEMATSRADLAPYFDMSKPGRYTVTAVAHIKDWEKEIVSQPRHFDVIQGIRFWEQEFGVPQSPDNHSQPEVRKYILERCTTLQQMKLYLRLTDATEARTLRIFPIGPMISFSEPQMRLDSASCLHVLYQESARTYRYSIVNPDGELRVRQTYYYTDSPPHLKTDGAGAEMVVGGERHKMDNDVPPSRKSVSTNAIPPPVP